MEHDDDEDGGGEGYGGGRTPDQFRELVRHWKRHGGDPPEPMTPDEEAIWEDEKPPLHSWDVRIAARGLGFR